jgi:hypothetical protein
VVDAAGVEATGVLTAKVKLIKFYIPFVIFAGSPEKYLGCVFIVLMINLHLLNFVPGLCIRDLSVKQFVI